MNERTGWRRSSVLSSGFFPPPFEMPYLGGKSQAGTWQRIVNLIPPHETYVEPFLGSGAILRLKAPARESIGLDLSAPNPALLELCSFTQGCGIAFLERHKFTGREFVYCDPPYLLSTRKSRKRYSFELTDADHRRLLRVIRRLPCPVLISGYPSALYDRALQGWNREAFQVLTRGHTWATEVLWFNYSRPVELHDFRRVGSNYRERLRIRRKRARWAARLLRQSPQERAALFSALVDVMGQAAAASAVSDAAAGAGV